MIDLALSNGKVWTVDKRNPLAEAVAVTGNEITAVGSNEEIKKLISLETKLIDLKGRLMLPGFIDNHVHFVSDELRRLGLDLSSAEEETHFVELVRRKAESVAKGTWITGGGWNHDKWPTAKLPTKGSITPGKLADMVILSDDILTMSATQIANARVDMTVFDGKVVYESEA